MKKKVPKFKNEDDERKFWATADSTDYVDWESGKRKKLVQRYAGIYARLKAIANDESNDEPERLIARLKLAEIPRNGNPTRIRNRCEIPGRPRAYYRKFRL